VVVRYKTTTNFYIVSTWFETMELDRQSPEILRELSIQSLTVPDLRDRTTLDDTQKVRHRIEKKLKAQNLVEEIGEQTPQSGGRKTEIWAITEEGKERAQEADIDESITLEEVVERLEEVEEQMQSVDETLKKERERIDNRATHSKVNRSIEEMEEQIQDMEQALKFQEGRVKQAGKRKAESKVAELKENVLESRLEDFKDNTIRGVQNQLMQIQESNNQLKKTNNRLRDDIQRKTEQIDQLEERIEELEENQSEGLLDKLF